MTFVKCIMEPKWSCIIDRVSSQVYAEQVELPVMLCQDLILGTIGIRFFSLNLYSSVPYFISENKHHVSGLIFFFIVDQHYTFDLKLCFCLFQWNHNLCNCNIPHPLCCRLSRVWTNSEGIVDAFWRQLQHYQQHVHEQ